MNPILYKAHPLLARWIDLLTHPTAQHPGDMVYLLTMLLAINVLWAGGLPWLLRKAEGLELTPLKAYLFGLPATFLYAPLMLTLLQDVVHHSFEFRHRWFLLLTLLVSSQLLTAFYAFTLRHERSGVAIGLESGLGVALFLLLVSIPASLILIGINALQPIF
jgi:hypothetical protein